METDGCTIRTASYFIALLLRFQQAIRPGHLIHWRAVFMKVRRESGASLKKGALSLLLSFFARFIAGGELRD